MKTLPPHPTYRRQREANELVEQTESVQLKQLLQAALTRMLLYPAKHSERPACEVDLHYYLCVLRTLFDRKDVLRAILDGEGDRYAWWDDDHACDKTE